VTLAPQSGQNFIGAGAGKPGSWSMCAMIPVAGRSRRPALRAKWKSTIKSMC